MKNQLNTWDQALAILITAALCALALEYFDVLIK